MDEIKTHLDEIVRVKNRAENKEVEIQIEIDQKNKELQDVVTKSNMIKFNDCFTDAAWLLLHEGGINYLVELDKVWVRENSISMVDTKMLHTEKDKFSVEFRKNSALTPKGYNARNRITLKYDTAIQLFAWMKDKFDSSSDSSENIQMRQMTDNDLLSHNFLLQMEQDRFECGVCIESNASKVVLCFQCNARMHLHCIPENQICPFCKHLLVTLDEDYADLENHPEMRPAILQKPLVLIQNPDLRERLGRLHNMAMHAQFGCTFGHGHCVG